MNTPEQALEIVQLLLRCGHYLHHNWGCGRASQFRALRILEENGEMTQRQLQDLMGIQQGSLSELVKKLEEQELITRSSSPKDRRQLLIRVTEKGQRLHHGHQERRQEESQELLGALSEEEQVQLRDLLDRLFDSWTERKEGPR